MKTIRQSQIGQLLLAAGQLMVEERLAQAYTAEQAVKNELLTIAKMVENGVERAEAEDIMVTVDVSVHLEAPLDQSEKVTS